MIIHSLTIRNWRNIGSLELCDLDHPLLVLYGPNRTGKSSIVAALRACLYDFDHDSTAAALVDAVPWHTKKAPEITVEFETGDARYRLTKRFSKRAEGDAILERMSNPSGWSVLQRGKEAGREARTLLGSQKSDDGLNQLLWLTQGDIHLPASARLSGSLQKRMQEVLGTLLTAHDWEFSQILERSCGTYFTKAMRDKPSSIIATLQQRHAECESTVLEHRRKLSQADALLREYQSLQMEIEEDERRLAESKQEVAALEQECAAAQDRVREHQLARQAFEAARQEFDRAAAALADYIQRRNGLSALANSIRSREPDLEYASAAHAKVQAELESATGQLSQVRAEREQHERGRALLEDYRRLLDLDRQSDRLAETLQRLDRAEAQTRALREEFAGLAAPDTRRLSALRNNRQQAAQLKARLDAAALRLELEPQRDVRVQIAMDSSPPAEAEAGPGKTASWLFRERAELRLGDCGTVRITRRQGDESLEQTAGQLESLDREYADALRQYGLDPTDDDALIVLSQRQAQRDSLAKQIRTQTQQLQELAPHGREQFVAEADRLQQQRAAILQRCPELGDRTLTEADYQSRQQEFERAMQRLRERQQECDACVERLQADERQADSQRRNLHEELQTNRIRLQAGQEELARCGDELALQDASKAAERKRDEAQQRVRQTQLTEKERTAADRLTAAQGALEQRQRRCTERTNHAHGVRGQLRGMEGLHEDLAAAEAELAEIAARLEEERLNAGAHRLLRERFEACRNRQVRMTTGRIATQVMTWAGRLGLDEYGDLEFSDGYLPSGLRRPETDRPVALSDESFGTLEQLALLIRLAVGRLVAKGERQVAILDDPLTHADTGKHRRMLEILSDAAAASACEENGAATLAPLQILIFTCHPERFDHLGTARQINLRDCILRE